MSVDDRTVQACARLDLQAVRLLANLRTHPAQILPQTFGDGLKAPASREDGTIDQVGLNMHRDDIPEGSWLDVGHGAKYWMVDLPPYGETR